MSLNERSLDELGLDVESTFSLEAAFELTRRTTRAALTNRPLLSRPATMGQYLTQSYFNLEQEVMGALYLNFNHFLMAEEILFRGSRTRLAVEPAAILRKALHHKAASIVLFHSHPDNDPKPSQEDFGFTRRMADAAELIGLKLLDHIVLGGHGGWVSLRQREPW